MSNLTTGFNKVEAPELVGCIQRHLERLEVLFQIFHQTVAAERQRQAKNQEAYTTAIFGVYCVLHR